MPYLDISIIKSSCLTTQEKELYGWYFNELSMGYYTSISGSRQERRACQWMQELTAHFWADVERTMKAARARLTDNLTQMMTTQCNMDSLDREEEKRKMRELHELLSMSVEAGEREVFGAAGETAHTHATEIYRTSDNKQTMAQTLITTTGVNAIRFAELVKNVNDSQLFPFEKGVYLKDLCEICENSRAGGSTVINIDESWTLADIDEHVEYIEKMLRECPNSEQAVAGAEREDEEAVSHGDHGDGEGLADDEEEEEWINDMVNANVGFPEEYRKRYLRRAIALLEQMIEEHQAGGDDEGDAVLRADRPEAGGKEEEGDASAGASAIE